MNEIIAEDFYEFGRSGRIYAREETLSMPKSPISASLTDFRVRLIGAEVAQVTYNSAVLCDGVGTYGRRSSIWSRSEGDWVLRFHQGTPYDG